MGKTGQIQQLGEWFVERLKPDDVYLIRSAQQFAIYLEALYPKHGDWLSRAIEDVKVGRRVAFGLFTHAPHLALHPKGTSAQYAGSVMLRHNPYSERVELKNLILDTNTVSDADWPAALERLLRHVYDYCEAKGFRRLEIELPPHESRLIASLHGHGFKIESVVRSKYRIGDFFYILVRALRSSYAGDPLDFSAMVEWVLATHLESFTISPAGRPSFVRYGKSYYLNRYDLTSRVPDELNPEDSGFELRGVCLVNTEDVEPEALPFPDEPGFRLYFTPNPSETTLVATARAQQWSGNEVRGLLGSRSEARYVYFDRSEIGGMIISVGVDYLSLMDDLASRNIERFVYFLFGGMGGLACAGTDDGSTAVALFNFPIPHDGQEPGIHFIATIDNVDINKPDALWGEYADMPSLINKDDLLFYTSFSRDNVIVALICSGLKRVQPNASFLDAVRHSEHDDEERVKAERFYKGTIEETGVVTTYVPKQVRDYYLGMEVKTVHSMMQTNVGPLTPQSPLSDWNTMEPMMIVQAISAGLGVVNQFIGMVRQRRDGVTEKVPQVEVSGDGVRVPTTAGGVEFVPTESIRWHEFDKARYDSLERRIRKNWLLYNRIYGSMVDADIAEKARLEGRLDDCQSELCRDLREVTELYERTLGVSMAVSSSLANICS
jgi:hypothetical protein